MPPASQAEATRLTGALLEAVTLHYAGRSEEAQAGLIAVENAAAAAKLSGLEARAQFERAALEAGLVGAAASLEWARRAETTANAAGAVREAAWAVLAIRTLVCVSSAGSKSECDEAASRAERLVQRVGDVWLDTWLNEQKTVQARQPMGELLSRWRAVPGADPELARCLRAQIMLLRSIDEPEGLLALIDEFLASGVERRPLVLALVRLYRVVLLGELDRFEEGQAILLETEPLRGASTAIDAVWRDERNRFLLLAKGMESVLETTAHATNEWDRLLRLDVLALLERWPEYDALAAALRDFGAASLSAEGGVRFRRIRLRAELRRGNAAAARALAEGTVLDALLAFQLALEERDEEATQHALASAQAAAEPTSEQRVLRIEGLIRAKRLDDARAVATVVAEQTVSAIDHNVALVLLSDALLLAGNMEAGCRAAADSVLADVHLSARQLKRSRALRRVCRP